MARHSTSRRSAGSGATGTSAAELLARAAAEGTVPASGRRSRHVAAEPAAESVVLAAETPDQPVDQPADARDRAPRHRPTLRPGRPGVRRALVGSGLAVLVALTAAPTSAVPVQPTVADVSATAYVGGVTQAPRADRSTRTDTAAKAPAAQAAPEEGVLPPAPGAAAPAEDAQPKAAAPAAKPGWIAQATVGSPNAVGCGTTGFNGVKPHVAQVGYLVMEKFGLSESEVGGVASRPNNPTSDHPNGLALDFMVDTAMGDQINAFLLQHQSELGIAYTMWQVPAHYDHVHVSFSATPGPGMPCTTPPAG